MARLEGTPGPDVILGSSDADALLGFGGDDRLDGGAGDDWLEGGEGADTLIGGPGFDYASYFNAIPVGPIVPGIAVVRANLEDPRLNGGAEAGGDSYDGIEGLIGSAYNDVLTGNALDNYLFGIGGNDHLGGRAGRDSLVGGDGNDQLVGGAGGDYLIGGAGFDTASYEDSLAAVVVDLLNPSANSGYAQDDAFSGIEQLYGSAYDDSLRGTDGADVVDGWHGNDSLYGRGGDDILRGGFGDDFLTGGEGADAHYGNFGAEGPDSGFDFALYTFATSGVDASLETGGTRGEADGDSFFHVDGLSGSAFADMLAGNSARNILFGGAGNDLLYGLAGDDALIGGAGNDDLNGGVGIDLYVFGVGDGHDLIRDFSAGVAPGSQPEDVIQLSAALGVGNFDQVMARAQTVNGQVVITFDAGTSITIADTPLSALSAANFLFVG